MKIDCQLDYRTILINQAQPVHAVLKLTAEKRLSERKSPLAFCAVLDRSGSMQGKPLDYAKKACETVVRNLNKDDSFSLVVFDDEAQVVFPLQSITRKDELLGRIKAIQSGGSTNLTGGWMLGRDELKKAVKDVPRRVLLLTDGQLNVGIIEPTQVERVVTGGLETDRVRTTCLGFGDNYVEDLLRQLAKCSGGEFYDADSPEKLPTIFKSELQGLQQISAQNVRVRLKPLDFCDALGQLSDYPVTFLPDKRIELAIGDLISEEDRVLVLLARALPLPLVNGEPVASLEGEKFLELEILWDEIGDKEIKSCRHEQVVRISGTQNPDEIKLNEETVAWIAVQCAGKTLDEATKDVDADRLDDAKGKLRQTLEFLRRYKLDDKAADGIRLLQDFLTRLESGELTLRERKTSSYSSSYYRKGSSKRVWSSPNAKPSFSKVQSVEEQMHTASDESGSGAGTKPPENNPKPPPSKKSK
jgi:Ca-activated chloride channel family protein